MAKKVDQMTTIQLTAREVELLSQVQPLRGGATYTHLVREAVFNYFSAELTRLQQQTGGASSPTQSPPMAEDYLDTFTEDLF